MESEDIRTGSADSENGSDNSYVQVSSEDVAASEAALDNPLSGEDTPYPSPPMESSEDIYGDSGEADHTLEEQVTSANPDTPSPDAFKGGEYIESPIEEELGVPEQVKPVEPVIPVEPVSKVEDVFKSYPTEPPVRSPSLPAHSGVKIPEAKGYLSFLNALHPIVLYMIYWRDVKLSAVVLGVDLVVLLTLNLNTMLHTIVLFLLSFLVVSLTYIVAKIVIDSFYNREVKNPFSDYLNKKITLPEDKIMEWTQFMVERLNQHFNKLVRLLLFDNIKQSLKFGFGLWLLSFVTNHLSVMCLLFIVVVLAFTVPPLYERFQSMVDANIDRSIKLITDILTKVKSKIPYIGKTKSD